MRLFLLALFLLSFSVGCGKSSGTSANPNRRVRFYGFGYWTEEVRTSDGWKVIRDTRKEDCK